uniref:NLR-type disease resistance protein n=1 Tax=Oryza brachyantha TaxID=4533 RepID=A0A8F5R5K5_ORYBR|nr:NLR-type disease resistance protein [Oryza brachyantha]QXN65408.1 NLR-type disease resistance protein [Oryza brachyantha]
MDVTVSAATGALAPVLVKLADLLKTEDRNLLGGSRRDAEFIRSELDAVKCSIHPSWDFDAACKADLLTEVRELSYDVDDAVDDFNLEPRGDEITNPFDELKTRVEHLSKWKLPVTSRPPSSVHRREPGLLPASTELVGMDERKEELIKLLEQGVDRGSSDASRWRKGKPHFPLRISRRRMAPPFHIRIVIKVAMDSNKSRSKAMRLIASMRGVLSVMIVGDDRYELVVFADDLDIIKLVTAIRKKVGYAELVQISENLVVVEETKTMPAAVNSTCEFDKVNTVCILGFAGGGKTTVAKELYDALGTKFQCRIFVSVSPIPSSPKTTEILADILQALGVTDTPSTPYGGTGTSNQQHIVDNISAFLVDKKYLIVIDDIWHWDEWEVIRKSIPKNDLGGRIIITTRLNSIAEKCHADDNDVFVYEVGDLDNNDALLLSERKAIDSGTHNRIRIGEDNPCYDIVNMCYGMPLALICLSSALAGRIEELGDDEAKKWRALRHIEDGILDIPSLKPLAENLCLGYEHLPLHLRTLLLYCSAYNWSDTHTHRIERGRLVWRWVAEGFVSEEKEAEGYFEELINRGWIKQHGCYYGRSIKQDGDSNSYIYYEIHPVMLAFLRCKSKEYNFVTCLGLGSDNTSSTSASSPRLIRRLALQQGYPVDFLSSSMSMDVSYTRSLVVLGEVTGLRFDSFKRLRVLDLEDNEDMEDSHLQGICEQLSLRLRYLGLKGTRISKLPREIRKLKHLEILYVGSTQISELPQEIEELKHLRVLDVRATKISALPRQIEELQERLQTLDAAYTSITELPPQIGKLQNLKTLSLRNTQVRELPKEIGELKNLQTLNLRNTQVRELPPEIGELKHLQTLDVRKTRVRELPWQCGRMSQSFRVLAGDSDEHVQLPIGVSEALVNNGEVQCKDIVLSIAILDRFGPPLDEGIFKVPGTHMAIPDFIKHYFRVLSCLDIRLCHKLEDHDQEFLAQMPCLRTLVLRFEALPREHITIKDTGFHTLERFRVDSRVPRITFQRGAMPSLIHLEFKFYVGLPSDDPVGIHHLLSLETVVFRCSEWYSSDAPGIKATIDVVKKEAKEHRNRISLRIINGSDEKISSIEKHTSSENIGSSSATSGVLDTHQDNNDLLPIRMTEEKGVHGGGTCSTCGRSSTIQDETIQDRVTAIDLFGPELNNYGNASHN